MPTKQDQSRGGLARAANMSPEERSLSSQHAAEVRWGGILPRETHVGRIKVGEREIPCAVLDNKMRVFSARGLHRVMEVSRPGGYQQRAAKSGGAVLPTFMASDGVKSLIPTELMVALISPIQYRPKHGGRTALGYRAELLPQICEVLLEAAAKDIPRTKELARMAAVLLRAFARIGVVALVDEATGYQEERAKDELARILEAYVQEEYRPWIRTFPEEFFRQIYRIHGWAYKPGTSKRTPLCGHLINKYIYGELPPGVLDELRRVNPVTEGGYRQRKHFQHLTADTGNEHLDRQITSVVTLMRISDTKQDLERNFARAFGKQPKPEQLPLILDDDEASK